MIRYRGLRFPPAPGVLPPEAERGLGKGTWQADHTAAVFALARPDDRALVLGSGVGHVAAILAGKLGLPHVTVVDRDAGRRAQLGRVAQANGLCRLRIVAHMPDGIAPTLLFADLERQTDPPELAAFDRLRAAAIQLAPEAPPTVTAAVFAAAGAAGMVYDAALSRGPALAFARL